MKREQPLAERDERILRAVYFFRYMTAVDVTRLLYSPSSLTTVRATLTRLSGGADYRNNQYLYRIPLPSRSTGNRERVYTLGSRGRSVLANSLGLPAEWYFRPDQVKHLGYSQMMHNLVLTRFLVAAQSWAKNTKGIRLARMKISYELAKQPISLAVAQNGRKEAVPVVPDAWLEFERVREGKVFARYPILLEIDRGTQYQQRFKQHIRSRIEYVLSGAYKRLFGVEAVLIAYATAGARPEHRDARRVNMCIWTQEVLNESYRQSWAQVFRFHALPLENIYADPIFSAPLWYRPDISSPIPLLE